MGLINKLESLKSSFDNETAKNFFTLDNISPLKSVPPVSIKPEADYDELVGDKNLW